MKFYYTVYRNKIYITMISNGVLRKLIIILQHTQANQFVLNGIVSHGTINVISIKFKYSISSTSASQFQSDCITVFETTILFIDKSEDTIHLSLFQCFNLLDVLIYIPYTGILFYQYFMEQNDIMSKGPYYRLVSSKFIYSTLLS